MLHFIMPIVFIIIVIVIIKVAGKPIFEKTTEAVSDVGKKAVCSSEIKSIEKKNK